MRIARDILTRAALAAVLLAGAAAAAGDPEIAVRDIPAGWAGVSMVPVRIDIRSGRGARVEISARYGGRDGTTARRVVSVPPNVSLTVETPVWREPGYSVDVVCRSGGETVQRSLYQPRRDVASFPEKRPVVFLCLNGQMLREIELAGPSSETNESIVLAQPAEGLPRRWQSYASLSGILVMDARDVGGILPEQRGALAMWVKWLGGRIWLTGPGREEAAAALGLEPTSEKTGAGEGVERFRASGGEVFLQEKADAAALVALASAGAPDIADDWARIFTNNLADVDGWELENFLLRDLDGVSNRVIILCLAVLGVAMGPLNYWYIRKRKTPLLFFVTTPLIAFAGTVAIVVAAMLAEGTGGKYRVIAVFLRNGEEGMLVEARGVRPGFFTPDAIFPATALVAPVGRNRFGEEYSMDWSADVVRPTSGWFRPRFPTALTAAIPLAGRMNIDVVEENGVHYATNNLGYRVDAVAARLPGGGYGQAGPIAPGQRAELRAGGGESMFAELFGRAKTVLSKPPDPARVALVARCDGLPQVEDRGISGDRISGEYYHCVLGTGEDAP